MLSRARAETAAGTASEQKEAKAHKPDNTMDVEEGAGGAAGSKNEAEKAAEKKKAAARGRK